MKIGIAGTQCAGKTTLLQELSYRLHDIKFIYEIAGEYTEKDRHTLKTQYDIMKAQIAAEKSSDHFISDRTVFDNWAYFSYVWETYDKDIPTIVRGRMDLSDYMFRLRCKGYHDHEMIHLQLYDVIFFVDEYFPLPEERMCEEHQQKAVFEKMKSYLPWMEKHCGKLVILNGSTKERVEKVMDEMRL